MARNDIYLNINSLSVADAVVTGQQDMTAATIPELVLGDTPTFNFYFTDNTNVWPSWAGNASYSLTWALSDAVAGDFTPAATTANATPITGGWSVVLPLNSYDLVGLLNTKRVGQPYPVQNLWQQLRVTDPSGNEITRAMFWTPVRYRAISDTQNTESASPTGGRFVTVNNVNTLTTPTAAQFYAANPVPTSALGTAANGELLIGNGTGFTKSTLTAGSGVSITNGSGSITITATDGDITLDDGTAAAPSLKFTADTDTGLFRPSDNVVGISAGGVSRATFGATSAINGTSIPANKTLVVTTDKLSALASTSSSELAGVISDETGTGSLVFANTPTLVTPNIGAATGTSVNLSGSGTFGGNLTVSGTGLSTVAGALNVTGALLAHQTAALNLAHEGSSLSQAVAYGADASTYGRFNVVLRKAGTGVGAITALSLNSTDATLAGNLTVSGAATGTSLALTGNVTAPDLILGTSGPSAKSSINARSARQGLVFDGTAGADVVTVPAFGTGDFTFAAWVNQSSLAAAYLCSASAAPDSAFLYLVGDGTFQWWSNSAARATSSANAIAANKWTLLTATRTGGTTTLYANGVSVGSGADSQNLASAINKIGQRAGGTNILNGTLIPLIYNRALSAAEVVSLFEAGVPSAADYNSASNTRINQATLVNGNSGASLTYNTFSGASATGFTAVKNQTSAESNVYSGEGYTVSAGQQFLVTFSCTLNSGTLPYLYISDWAGSPLYNSAPRITAGSNSILITVNKAGTGARLRFYSQTSELVDYAISNLSVTRLGLLLAPDAAQAGGGLVWYDTSGNAANISWTSGVSWNVPTSGKIGAALTIFSGKTTVTNSDDGRVAPTGSVLITNGNYGSTSTMGKLVLSGGGGNNSTQSGWYLGSQNTAGVGGPAPYLDIGLATTDTGTSYGTFTSVGRFFSNGNLFIGASPVDGGQKLQVNGNSGFLGHIEIPADKHIYLKDGNPARWSSTGLSSGTLIADIYASSNSLYFRTNGATLALTLDSSQRTILAGALRLANAYVATPQVTTGYVTIQDSTGTTYKVLVAA